MTPRALRMVLGELPASCPIADAYEQRFRAGPGRRPWYRHQKEHLLGWLGEYEGPGAYNRTSRNLDAKHAYNHFQCPPGLIWMAEALGEDPIVVDRAMAAAVAEATGGKRPATQCRVIRELIPWARIAELIDARRPRKPAKRSRPHTHAARNR